MWTLCQSIKKLGRTVSFTGNDFEVASSFNNCLFRKRQAERFDSCRGKLWDIGYRFVFYLATYSSWNLPRVLVESCQEVYRFELTYSRTMLCDTLSISDSLTIAILSEKPSYGSLSLIEGPELFWKTKTEFCEWHSGVERDVRWCDRYKGRRCLDWTYPTYIPSFSPSAAIMAYFVPTM